MWHQAFCLKGVVILQAIGGTLTVQGLGWMSSLHNISQDEYFCMTSDGGTFSSIPVRSSHLNSGGSNA